MHESWTEPGTGWPVDPAAPARASRRVRRPGCRREHVADCRHAADVDGNEEQERQRREADAPSSRVPVSYPRGVPEDGSGEWVASRPFTLEEELEDTWPNLPPREGKA